MNYSFSSEDQLSEFLNRRYREMGYEKYLRWLNNFTGTIGSYVTVNGEYYGLSKCLKCSEISLTPEEFYDRLRYL